MTTDSQTYLNPEVLDRVAGLELKARLLAMEQGRHHEGLLTTEALARLSGFKWEEQNE